MLLLARRQWLEMIGHSLDRLPEEACGLLAGRADGSVDRFFPCTNTDASARTYSMDGREILSFERALEAEGLGLGIVGVMHSHTHTDAYPSPTDVERAALLGDWHFLILSLRQPEPVARSYRIIEGEVAEEPIVFVPE